MARPTGTNRSVRPVGGVVLQDIERFRGGVQPGGAEEKISGNGQFEDSRIRGDILFFFHSDVL